MQIPFGIGNISAFFLILHGLCLPFAAQVIDGTHGHVPLDLAGMVLGSHAWAEA